MKRIQVGAHASSLSRETPGLKYHLPSPAHGAGAPLPPVLVVEPESKSERKEDDEKEWFPALLQENHNLKFEIALLRDSVRMAAGSKPFDFICTFASVLTSSAGGILQGFIPFDPNTIVYNEYGSLGALFDEVKLVHAEIQFVPLISAAGTVNVAGVATPKIFNHFVCGVDRDAINTATASTTQVLRLDGSLSMTNIAADNLPSVIKYKPKGLGYCTTAVSATINPPAGCVGLVRYACLSTVSTSTDYYRYVVKAKLRFRNRV